MASPMTLGQFSRLADVGLSNIWHDAIPPVEEQFSRLVNIRDMEKVQIEDAKMAGFGPLQIRNEGASTVFDTAIAPISRFYNLTEYSLGYKLTQKLVTWELYGEVAKLERDLMRSSTDHIERFVIALFDNATATTVSTGFDGLALASTAHTRLDGGTTWANRPTSLTALSLAALHDAVIHFDTLTNDRGRPVNADARTLLIVPQLRLQAVELLQSSMRPDTANNSTNAISREGLTPMVSRYLSGTTYWSVIGDFHDINFFWGQRPVQTTDTEFASDTMARKVVQSYARGHGEARGYYQGQS
jgi:hypothetical protein